MDQKTVLIFDFQNLVETFRGEGRDLKKDIPLAMMALLDVCQKEWGKLAVPQIVVSADFPAPYMLKYVWKIGKRLSFIVSPPQRPGMRDEVDSTIVYLIHRAIEDPNISTIVLISADRDFKAVMRQANSQKPAIQMSSREISAVIGELSEIDLDSLTEKVNPFPSLVLEIQSDQNNIAEQEPAIEFLKQIVRIIIGLVQEKPLQLNKLITETWKEAAPATKEQGGKFNYYHCREAILALNIYSDFLNQNSEGIMEINLQSPLLFKLCQD